MLFQKNSNVLKFALFATGLAGIVAEYVLATLATYFLGDSVLQWTMIISTMLFSMGLGSRISKVLTKHLLEKFIYVEFALSVLTSFSALAVYSIPVYLNITGILIYGMAIAIGILIGIEIPVVIRINNEFESLRENISSVMEKDYYGSLAGGVFFAFIGLPFLGLTYTPLVLGSVNYLVALLVLIKLRKYVAANNIVLLRIFAIIVSLVLLTGFLISRPVILYGEQNKYKDKIVYSEQSIYQKIVITQWKDDYWLFINGNQQLSTVDEHMYHEPLVHPVMNLAIAPSSILVLGGGDGCAVREILKYNSVEEIVLVDIDPAMTDLGCNNPILTRLNKNSLNHPVVEIVNQDAFQFLEKSDCYFDIIIVDLPDPNNVELGRLYSIEFYQLCNLRLRSTGVMITQAGSPYYTTRAFNCIEKTMSAANFTTMPLHNQILTLGEWGWIIGSKSINKADLKTRLLQLQYNNIETYWINNEAMSLLLSFGKPIFGTSSVVEVNTLINPVLYQYYLKGNWDIY